MCTSLADLIHIAYDQNAINRPVNSSMSDLLQPMKGGPSWIYSERYTVEAKADGAPNRRTVMGPMLQALLEERFHLRVHQDTEQIGEYALTLAKGGPKLQRLKEGGCAPLSTSNGGGPTNQGPRCATVHSGRSGTNRTLDVVGMSVAGFSGVLRNFVDRPILDKTGLAGLYVFHLEYAPDEFAKGIYSGDDSPSGRCAVVSGDEAQSEHKGWLSAAPSDPSSGQSIFGALQQQLGLKLEPTKGPHGFLVIDQVKGLSEN